MNENELSKIIINAAIEIHKQLGPGLLESVYEKVLAYELEKQGLKILRQPSVPIHYKGIDFAEGFRADIIVDDKVIIEIKSVEEISKVHKKQLLTYLRLSNIKLRLLLNFNEELLKDGITRVVNKLEE